MDPIQTMPLMHTMTEVIYTPKQWITYYKNTWVRNCVARTIDVKVDEVKKAKNPDELVEFNGQEIPVKVRLEHRKMLLQDALELVTAADLLNETPAEEWDEKVWSEKALAVAEDMKPQEAAVGAEQEVKLDESPAPVLTKYQVVDESGITIKENDVDIVKKKGEAVELEPEHEQTIAWVQNNQIAAVVDTNEPSSEAKV